MEALAGTQVRMVTVPGKKRKHRSMIPMAMANDVVEGLQTAPPSSPGTLVDANGQEYVAG